MLKTMAANQQPEWDPESVDPETQNWTELIQIQLRDYVNFCIQMWKAQNSKDASLWEALLDAFGHFTIDTFRNIPQKTKRELRNFLRQNGVFVTNTPRISINQALYSTCLLETQPIWPQDELIAQIQHIDGLTSRLNAAWAREHGKQPLARTLSEAIQEIQMPIHNSQPSITQPFLTPTTTHPAQPESRCSIRSLRSEPVASVEDLRSHFHDSPTPTPANLHQLTPTESPKTVTPLPTNPSVKRLPKANYVQCTTELIVLSELYKDDMQYSGFGDNFQRKLSIFEDICFKIGIPNDGKPLALSFMLKDMALDFYYDRIRPLRPTFNESCLMITTHFEGFGWEQDVRNEWNMTTLSSTIANNPGKSTSECLFIMVRTLSTLQLGLRDNQRDTETLRDKVLDACRGMPATAVACSSPAQQFGALIYQLKASILIYESLPDSDRCQHYPVEPAPVDELFTDQHFRRWDNWMRLPHDNPGDRSTSKPQSKRCFVCRKPDCRSYRHSRDEKDAAWKKYRDKIITRLSQRLDTKARQFIADFEGHSDERDGPDSRKS